MVKMVKNEHYELVFLDFFRKCTLHRAEFFLRCIQCTKPLLLSYCSPLNVDNSAL